MILVSVVFSVYNVLYMCISQLRVQSSVVDTRTVTCVNGYYNRKEKRDRKKE